MLYIIGICIEWYIIMSLTLLTLQRTISSPISRLLTIHVLPANHQSDTFNEFNSNFNIFKLYSS